MGSGEGGTCSELWPFELEDGKSSNQDAISVSIMCTCANDDIQKGFIVQLYIIYSC